MARQLLRDVASRRRMPREIGEHFTALLGAAGGVAFAEDDLIAGLMKALDEDKVAAVFRLGGGEIQVQPVSTLAKLVTSACE